MSRDPEASSLAANASAGTSWNVPEPPWNVRETAPAVVGKSADPVDPVITTLPSWPSASAPADSTLEPPTYVEYRSREPSALSSATKPSPIRPPQQSIVPLKLVSYAP